MRHLDEITSPLFEDAAGQYLEGQLAAHGQPPWSICEARLSPAEFDRLLAWGASVQKSRMDDQSGRAGLVLFALIAEWNRRNSPGDEVFPGLPALFGIGETRNLLFHADGQPNKELRRLIRRACTRFKLRNAFDPAQDEDRAYYLSIQLQYGFSLPHAQEQLPSWLAGHPWRATCRRLLAPDGVYRSRSFQHLVADLRAFRNDYLPEADLRRALALNPWVLAGSEDVLVRLAGISRDVTPPPRPPFEPLSPPRVEWDDGPRAVCRVLPLPGVLDAPRYVLRHEGQDIVRYYRMPGGVMRPDHALAVLPLSRPEVVVSLETPEGECVHVQTVRLWDPGLPVQVLPLDRQGDPSERLLHESQVLVTSQTAVVTPEPTSWRLLGPKGQRRRWWVLDAATDVLVDDNGLLWTGHPPAPPPAWTNRVDVTLRPPSPFFGLEDHIQLGIERPADVRVVYALCEGEPLAFTDDQRVLTERIAVRPEMAGEFRMRVGLESGGQRAEITRMVHLPVRGAAWVDGAPLGRHETVLASDGPTRPIRLFTDGPLFLMEGHVAHHPLEGQARLLGNLLGTGSHLRVVDRPYGTDTEFRLAETALDTGLARSLHQEGADWHLELLRPLPPGDRHSLLLWSPELGVVEMPCADIRATSGGRSWVVRCPWQPRTMLAAVVYEGLCMATAYHGERRWFFQADPGDSLTPLARVALIRWSRLPGLLVDPQGQGRPMIRRLVWDHLADTLRVALNDDGLQEGLAFDSRRELFDTMLREVFFDFQPNNQAAAVCEWLGYPDVAIRLLPYHPLLGCRVLRAAFLPAIVGQYALARVFLEGMWLKLASLPTNATAKQQNARRDELLGDASKTLSEGSDPMDTYAIEGMVHPTLEHLFVNGYISSLQQSNLRLALGSASFRLYLALAILHKLHETLV